MPSIGVCSELNSGTYFLTLTTQRWYYLFDRYNRWAILADSLRYCIDHKGLELNGYVFMINHLHLIVKSQDVAGFLRDFKKFTSKRFKENLQANEPSVLSLFVDDEGQYRFWMEGNAPKKVENHGFYVQKLNYIHENPVRKGYVAHPEYWFWSSANASSSLPVKFFSA